MTSPFLTTHTAALPASVPFVGPETQQRQQGRPFIARLGANESLFGPSPRALAAMKAAADEVWMYGDPECHDLKAAIAARHGTTPAHVVVGEGIDGLFGWLVRLICDPGAVFVTSIGAYPTFNFHVTGYGGQLVRVPYRQDHEDPEALLAAARTHQAKAIYLANPDNPMGTWAPASVIEDMLAHLPATTLLVLDEAYLDLAPPDTEPKIDPDHPNVIRFRTFSKAYGMAGARVGYAITNPNLAAAFDRVRNHFGVGRVVQAGALAALADQDHLGLVQKWAHDGRAQLTRIAQDNGLVALPSATNFVTMDCGSDGDFARKVLQSLIARGIFIRMPGVAPLDRCIRVSLGDQPALQAFAEALPLALKDARA